MDGFIGTGDGLIVYGDVRKALETFFRFSSWLLSAGAHSFLLTIFLMSAMLTGCKPKSQKLFATDCENANANCENSSLRMSTNGARSDLADKEVSHGGKLGGVMMKPVRKGESTEVEFAVYNMRLLPLRQFSMNMQPGGLDVDTSAASDCSKKWLLGYKQSCTVKIRFAPGAVVADQILQFHFLTLTGEQLIFDADLGGSKILSEFYVSGSTNFGEELIFDPFYISAPFSEQTLTITNSGSEDDIRSVHFDISGTDASDFTLQSSGANACTEGQDLAANGGSCTLIIRFRPTAPGLKNASLVLIGGGSYGRTIDLTGTATAIRSSEDKLDFGMRELADGALEKTIQISNPGAPGEASARQCTYTLSGDGFSLASNTCGSGLDSTTSCDLTIRFTPSATSEWHGGDLQVSCTERGGSLSLSLVAQSIVNELKSDKVDIDFGDLLVGSTGTASLTLSNTGNTTLTSFATTITPVLNSGFSISAPFCPTSFPSASTCPVTLTFAPVGTSPASAFFNATSSQTSLASEVPVHGVGITILSSLPIVDFGSVLIGSDRLGPAVYIINPSKTQSAESCALDSSALASSGFTLDSGSTCTSSTSLGPEQSCILKPRFTAQGDAGVRAALLRFSCAIGGSAQVSLLAEAVADLRLIVKAPTSIAFNNRLVGVTDHGNFTLMNAHATDTTTGLAVNLPTLTSPWSRGDAGASDCSLVSSLAAGQTCDIRLNYAPSAAFGAEQTGTTGGSISVSAAGGAIEPADPTYSASALKITPSRSTYDFGTTSTGLELVSPIFIVQNPSSVDTASGCILSASNGFQVDPMTCGASISPSRSCSLRAKLPAQSSSTTLSGHLRMDCTVGGRAEIALNAIVRKPPVLQWSGTASFGTVDLGQNRTQTFTLTHSGTAPDNATTNLAISLLSVLPSGFSLASPHNCPAQLQPGQSCSADIKFTPSDTNPASDTLRAYDPADTEDLLLSGTGIDPSQRVVPTPTSVTFSNRLIGMHLYQDITLTNAAADSATGLGVGAPTSGAPWTLGTSDSPCSSTLASSSTCAARLKFDPVSAGSSSGTLTISASNLTPSKVISYSGTATKISASVASLDFGTTPVNVSKTHSTTVTISNPSSLDTATSCALSLPSQFSTVSSTCAGSIAPGSSCSFGVQLAAQSSEVTISSTATMSCAVGGTASIELNAVILDYPDLRWTLTSDASFGPVKTDAAAVVRTFTLTNHESYSVPLTGFGLKLNAASFALSGSSTTCTASTTLQPSGTAGSSCTASVAFDPSTDTAAAGGESGILFAQTAVPATQNYELTLTGTGIDPATYILIDADNATNNSPSAILLSAGILSTKPSSSTSDGCYLGVVDNGTTAAYPSNPYVIAPTSIINSSTFQTNLFSLANRTRLNKFTLRLKRMGGPSGEMRVQLFATSAGVPSGSALATAQDKTISTSISLTDAGNLVDFDLAAPYDAAAGTYALVLSPQGATLDGNNNFGWATSNSSGCSNFPIYLASFDEGSTWVDDYNAGYRRSFFNYSGDQFTTSGTAAWIVYGSGRVHWNMSTITFTEDPSSLAGGTITYDVGAGSSASSPTYSQTSLTLSQLQAISNLTGPYLYIRAHLNTNGGLTDRISLGDGSISVY